MSPTAAPARPEVVTREFERRGPQWMDRATRGDHKSVGLLYIATALSFLALAATEFVLVRLQLLVPESTIISPEIFNRVLTAAGTTAVILFAIPLTLGLIAYVVPLQIGARGVALPRLNLLSYWLYLAGGVAIYASFLYTPPETGVAALPPLSDTVFAPSSGTDAWITGVGLATLGFVCFAVNLVATVGRMRAPGLAWRRMPPFAWAASAIGYLLLVAGPAMLAALVMLFIDRNFDGVFFDPGEGGAPLLYEHLATIFMASAYGIVLVAAAGIVSEILPTFARKPLFSLRATAASLVAIAVLTPLAWMQSLYEAPIAEGWTIMAMAFALALAVPLGTLFYVWIATLWNGALELRAAALYAIVGASTISVGLAAEFAYSVIPVGWLLDNTTAAQGDTILVLVGGAVMVGFAGLHYWFPKLCGRVLGEGLGRIALGVMFVGVHLYVWPMFLAGLEGQPVDVFKYFESAGVDGYNLVASIGAFVLGAGILLALGGVAHSYTNGRAAGHDPWGGSTLEWFALSPPPPHNFDAVPDVRSAEPMRDIRDAVRAQSEAFAAPEPLERIASPAAEEPPPPAAEEAPEEPAAEASEEGEAGTDGGGGPSVA
jgi:heme/copper-type cytochrome/quinol oxidase subunit 1